MNHKQRTTIIVSPRERFLPLVPSLRSLFSTIDKEVPVVVVDGGAPDSICSELQKLKQERDFNWIHNDHFKTPHQARNIGFGNVDTEFVVFSDNDIHYEDGWLVSLEKNSDLNDSDIVAPLICIGPPEAEVIHHAGGMLASRKNGLESIELYEKHRLMNKNISEVTDNFPPLENQVTEFHCFLARSECVRDFGPLDERLITREQMDFALRAIAYGKKVTFERSSVVTYMAFDTYDSNDLDYMLFRWSEELARRSVIAFVDTWKVSLDENRILYGWIENHRMRAMISAYPTLSKLMGGRIFRKYAKYFIEKPRTIRAFKNIQKENISLPFPINNDLIRETLERIPLDDHV